MQLRIGVPSLHGSIRAPSSKSHTIRALICAALADSPSLITAPLVSADTAAAVAVLRQLGSEIRIMQSDPQVLEVCPPPQGLPSFLSLNRRPAAGTVPEIVLDLGNSGSLLYFLGVVLAAAEVPVCLTGDRSLQGRPVEPLTALYRQAGIRYSVRKDGTGAAFPPIRFCGPLQAGNFQLTGPFSQPVTGLLLTAPLLHGTTRIVFKQAGELPYLRMTCGWMQTAGISFAARNGRYFEISGPQRYRAFSETIPGDWSSALFPLTAAVICNTALTICNLNPADSQGDSQAVDILRSMGADIRCDSAARTVSAVPITGSLQGGTFDCAGIPDAVPILAAAALFCSGTTRLINAGVCRFKECDRLQASAEELQKFGAHINAGIDFLKIEGSGGQGLYPATVNSRGDHRMAMMLTVAACGIAARIHTVSGTAPPFSYVEDTECIGVSYPGFIRDMNAAGAVCSGRI
ncbi:MAG: 3-phosphoshikimate 1-carboxyvinyltransferase [Treponema sp.]